MELPEDPETRQALERALRLLRAGDRFEAEVRAHLAREGASVEAIDGVVRWLGDRRFLDDARTAQNALDRRTGRRAVSGALLREELAARGAPADLIARVESSDAEAADGLLAARFRPSDKRARAGRFLFSRGFEEDVVESALDRFFGPASDAQGELD